MSSTSTSTQKEQPESPGVALKKRSRTENWLENDKLLLQDLVRERVHIIENKNTDSNTNKKKRDAWADLHNIFNSVCTGAHRTIPQLKNQWGITKINVKKEKAQHRREVLKTGGGPCPKDPADSHDPDDISSWLPGEFTIDHNEYDCDTYSTELGTLPKGLEIICPVKVVEPMEIVPPPLRVPTPHPEEAISIPLEVEPEDVISIPLEVEDPLETTTAAAVTTMPVKNIKKLKSKKKQQTNDSTATATAAAAAAKIMEVENKCRQELHQIQMENERKRSRNLDLKYELLQAKLNFYKSKS